MGFPDRSRADPEDREKKAASPFIRLLVGQNGLEAIGVDRFIFYPGMLFGTTEKWWGKSGVRHSRHEGIDLCFFQTVSGHYCRMDESIKIPMAAESRVVHIMDDYLGRTVVVGEPENKGKDRPFLTIYAHLETDKNLRIGDKVSAGEVFANIAAVDSPKIPLLPHLHISMAWADQLPDFSRWSWKLLNQCGSECFVNPFERFLIPRKILPFEFGMDLKNEFTPCSRLAGFF
jgi:hypothetical protein